MKIYTCNKFTGHYPVGSAAVVRALTRAGAATKLNNILRDMGLPGDAKMEDMIPFGEAGEDVRVLVDGNY